MLAVFCMISLGLIFATRITSEELASGLMNIVTLPMILISGVFFSLEGSPAILRAVSQAFPLTHFVEGARAIMLEGAGIVELAPNLLALVGFTAAFLFIAALLFRWE
jgi:ABC-type multidrug transport system permease subunit